MFGSVVSKNPLVPSANSMDDKLTNCPQYSWRDLLRQKYCFGQYFSEETINHLFSGPNQSFVSADLTFYLNNPCKQYDLKILVPNIEIALASNSLGYYHQLIYSYSSDFSKAIGHPCNKQIYYGKITPSTGHRTQNFMEHKMCQYLRNALSTLYLAEICPNEKLCIIGIYDKVSPEYYNIKDMWWLRRYRCPKCMTLLFQ